MSLHEKAVGAACTTAGQILRAATRIVSARPTAKPLHPRGHVVTGSLRRFGGDETTGSTWLDEEEGEDHVLVRQSRAVGLPAPFPDVFGLAVRVPLDGGRHGDLLFATTGLGRLTRYTLTAARSPYGRPMTTLLPNRTGRGSVLLSAVYRDEHTVDLAWAVASGTWHRFAQLVLSADPADEQDVHVSFDPVLNRLPGLDTYEWVRRLREPAYSTARRSRGRSGRAADERDPADQG